MTESLPVRGSTRVTGVIGWPVAHSLSPVMHNAAFRSLGLDFAYVPFAVRPEDLAQAVAGIRAMRIAGINVTIPHKESILPLLDRVHRDARVIGAVNTVVRSAEGQLEGHNTDGAGFLASLQEDAGLHPEGLRVVVLGAGGAGRAVAVALALAGALQVTVANRTLRRAQKLCSELTEGVRGATFEAAELERAALRNTLASADLVVNCTSLGMNRESVADLLPLEVLPGHAVVSDVVYVGGETPLVREARRIGRRAFGGLGMLVHQGAISQELWTGTRPPASLLAEVARGALTGSGKGGSSA